MVVVAVVAAATQTLPQVYDLLHFTSIRAIRHKESILQVPQ